MIKTYRASWTIRSGFLAVVHIITLTALAFFIVTILPAFTTSLLEEKRILPLVVIGMFPVVMIGAACIWLYGVLTLFVKSYTLSFIDGVLVWQTNGAVIPTRRTFPIQDIRGLRHLGEVAEFHRLEIRTSTKGYGIYPILSKKDVADLMETICEWVEAARAGVTKP